MTPAEQIAAEISARYGIPVSPAVVQILPARMAVEPDYVWCEKANFLIARDKRKHALRDAINVEAIERKRAWKSGNFARVAARDNRVADLKAFAANGITIEQLAERMGGVSVKTAERYARQYKIPYIGKPGNRQASKNDIAERRAQVRAMDAQGKSTNEIARAMGMTTRQVRRDLGRA